MKMYKNELEKIANRRKIISELEDALEVGWELVEATPDYKSWQKLKEKVDGFKEELRENESAFKEQAVKEYVQYGMENPKPIDGLQIKKFKIVHILDEETAKEWASENAPQVLSLKKAQFNKIAKVLDLDFVQINDEYRAQIASDLSMYEEKENV